MINSICTAPRVERELSERQSQLSKMESSSSQKETTGNKHHFHCPNETMPAFDSHSFSTPKLSHTHTRPHLDNGRFSLERLQCSASG